MKMERIILCDNGKIEEISKLCKKYSLGVNIDSYYRPDYLEKNPNSIEQHLRVYNDIEICSIHGPYFDLNYGSNDNLIKEVTKKRFEYAYSISSKINCRSIILHNGYVPGTSFPSNWIKRAKSFWDEFLENKDEEIVFYIENLLEHDPGMIIELINSVNKKNLKMCFDIGHANVYSKIKVTEWVKKVNANIRFVHLHNNNGETDEHNGISNGTLNVKEVCEYLEEYSPKATWAIETIEYEKSIEWLKENKFLE